MKGIVKIINLLILGFILASCKGNGPSNPKSKASSGNSEEIENTSNLAVVETSKKVAIVYGTNGGSTKKVAERISSQLSESELFHIGARDFDIKKLEGFDVILFGTPTYGNVGGQPTALSSDWIKAFGDLKAIDLSDKEVALFGLGSSRWADTFVNGMRIIYNELRPEVGNFIGRVSSKSYNYKNSTSVIGDKFIGLAIDVTESSERQSLRVDSWVQQLSKEIGVDTDESDTTVVIPINHPDITPSPTEPTTPTAEVKDIAIVYGTNGGKTKKVAEDIHGLIKNSVLFHIGANDFDIKKLDGFKTIIFGTPTYGNVGNQPTKLSKDWIKVFDSLKKIDLSKKTVSFFGLGSSRWSNTFVNGIKIIYDEVAGRAEKVVGMVSTDDYNFTNSSSVIDGKFLGLAIDITESPTKQNNRIKNWIEQVNKELSEGDDNEEPDDTVVPTEPTTPTAEVKDIAIVYGTNGGKTKKVAEDIHGLIKNSVLFHIGANDFDIKKLNGFKTIIFGTPTYGNVGNQPTKLSSDWIKVFDSLKKIDLSKKTVSFFGLGSSRWSNTFVNGIKIIYDEVAGRAEKVVGMVSTDDYNFTNSSSVIDGKFLGLAIDVTESPTKQNNRIKNWVEQVNKELHSEGSSEDIIDVVTPIAISNENFESVVIVYGSKKGYTKKLAEIIHKKFPHSDLLHIDECGEYLEKLESYDTIILGTPTYSDSNGRSELSPDWRRKVRNLEMLDLEGKNISFFGTGSSNYESTFVDGIGILYNRLADQEANFIGSVSGDGYTFKKSKAFINNRFIGLPIENIIESDVTRDQVNNWVSRLKSEITVGRVAIIYEGIDEVFRIAKFMSSNLVNADILRVKDLEASKLKKYSTIIIGVRNNPFTGLSFEWQNSIKKFNNKILENKNLGFYTFGNSSIFYDMFADSLGKIYNEITNNKELDLFGQNRVLDYYLGSETKGIVDRRFLGLVVDTKDDFSVLSNKNKVKIEIWIKNSLFPL